MTMVSWYLLIVLKTYPQKSSGHLGKAQLIICSCSHKILCDSSIMIEKAWVYTMNALNKSSELWHTSVNRKARPAVEGEHDKSLNDHGFVHSLTIAARKIAIISVVWDFCKTSTKMHLKCATFISITLDLALASTQIGD